MRKDVVFNVSVSGQLNLGRNIFINDGTKLNARDCIDIGDDCIIGQNVLIYDHDHDYTSNNMREKFKTASVKIGNNVWIGSGVIILKGVVVGDNSVIAAGSIVKESIPNNTLYYRKLGEARMVDIDKDVVPKEPKKINAK